MTSDERYSELGTHNWEIRESLLPLDSSDFRTLIFI